MANTAATASEAARGGASVRHASNNTTTNRGYHLPDFSSDEEEEDEAQDSEDDDDENDGSNAYKGDNDSLEDEGRLDWNSAFNLLKLDSRNPAFHVASLASRRGPWDVRDERERSLAKKHVLDVVDKMYKEVEALQQTPSKAPAPSYIKEFENGQLLARQGLQQANALKEKRSKEIKDLNDNLSKDIDACLAILEQERREEQRIRDEAIRKEREERERQVREAEEKKKALEAKKKEEEQRLVEAKKKQEEQAKEAAKKKAERAAQATANVDALNVSPTSKEEYDKYWSVFWMFRNNIKPAIAANMPLKKQVNAIKREMVPAVGQLVNTRDSIIECFKELLDAFNKAKQLGQEAYIWVMYFTAKTFVIQAETEARINAGLMYQYAQVIVLLLAHHPLFMDVMMARFVKKCPYVTPVYPTADEKMTADDYKKKLAYVQKDGKWEDETEYIARQSAIFALYCAIMQTTPLQGSNPYPIHHGWTWMARILNMPPRAITPNLINVFLDICGPAFLDTYRGQALKVLQLLFDEFLVLIPKKGGPGTSRLKQALIRFFGEDGRRFRELPERYPKNS
ncbi:hypothetical protein BGZ73_005649 [Actinomortierella ambigua]|nr:hypothetical protein BGZ73_005649 [Actinomortierella ambigua]